MFPASTHTNYLDYVFKEPPNYEFGEPLILIILSTKVKQPFLKNRLPCSDDSPSDEAGNFDKSNY